MVSTLDDPAEIILPLLNFEDKLTTRSADDERTSRCKRTLPRSNMVSARRRPENPHGQTDILNTKWEKLAWTGGGMEGRNFKIRENQWSIERQ